MYRAQSGLAFTGVAASTYFGYALLAIAAGTVLLLATLIRTRFRRHKSPGDV